MYSVSFGQDADPFGVNGDKEYIDPVKTRVKKKAYVDYPQYMNLSKLQGDDADGVEDKRAFKFFNKPSSVWVVKGGLFVAYDAGEFGGALYFFAEAGKQRSFVCNQHISDLVKVNDSTYLASGGLSHLSLSSGAVVRVDLKAGVWESKILARFFTGIPHISELKANGNFVVETWFSHPSGHFNQKPDGKGNKSSMYTGFKYEVTQKGWMKQLFLRAHPIK